VKRENLVYVIILQYMPDRHLLKSDEAILSVARLKGMIPRQGISSKVMQPVPYHLMISVLVVE
jgi:hypothetical protein